MTTRKRPPKAFLQLVRPPRPIEDVLSEIPHVSPWIHELLRTVNDEAPGSVERAIDRTPLIRARTSIGSTAGASGQGRTHGPAHEADRFGSFVQSIVSAIDLKCELFRVSLHAPRGVDRDIAPYLNAYAGEIADQGEHHGAWLVIDRRDDGSEHVHGIVACTREYRQNLIPRWCGLTGASQEAHEGRAGVVRISGSHHHAMTGDSSLLEPNLGRVIRYSMHKLPGGAVKDLDLDVVATGALAALWSAFRVGEATEGASPHQERFPGYGQSVPRTCAVCGGPIAPSKRKHATSCSRTCKRRKHALKKKSGQ